LEKPGRAWRVGDESGRRAVSGPDRGVQRAAAEQASTDSVGLCSILVTIEAAPPCSMLGHHQPARPPAHWLAGWGGAEGWWVLAARAAWCWGWGETCASRVQLGGFKSFCWPSKSLDGMLNLDRNGTETGHTARSRCRFQSGGGMQACYSSGRDCPEPLAEHVCSEGAGVRI